MLEPYFDRLSLVCDMLESPQEETVQEAYDLLFKLWTEYSGNVKFIVEMKNIIKSYPIVTQEFTDRLDQSNLSDEEKARFDKIVDVEKPSDLKTIDLFLASSSELKGDRTGVEVWVRRENDKLIRKGFYLDLQIWEEFIDAMVETRSQDRYNDAVAESDVVVCLFGTKAGKYTEEEFDVAHANFIEKGKPRYIFTYFKDVQLSTAKMNLEDFNQPAKLQR